jgi:hypothetical protein
MHDSAFIQQVAEEAKLELAREFVLDVLRVRFGEKAVADCQRVINSVQKLEQLTFLHRLAVKCRDVAEFRPRLPQT